MSGSSQSFDLRKALFPDIKQKSGSFKKNTRFSSVVLPEKLSQRYLKPKLDQKQKTNLLMAEKRNSGMACGASSPEDLVDGMEHLMQQIGISSSFID